MPHSFRDVDPQPQDQLGVLGTDKLHAHRRVLEHQRMALGALDLISLARSPRKPFPGRTPTTQVISGSRMDQLMMGSLPSYAVGNYYPLVVSGFNHRITGLDPQYGRTHPEPHRYPTGIAAMKMLAVKLARDPCSKAYGQAGDAGTGAQTPVTRLLSWGI